MSTTLTKRPWAVAMIDADDFRGLFPKSSYERWEIAGSVRRQRPLVGDVEHVVIPVYGEVERGDGLFAVKERVNLLWHRLDALAREGQVSKHVYGWSGYRWGEIYRGCDFRGFNHEFFLADPDNFGGTLLIRTGPAEFSERVVTRMKDGGMYRQRDGYVWRVGTGERVPVADEAAYFRLAGMPYVEPELRR
jgi:DNA polymerase/3'-5' exonuclease PolX